MQISTQKTSCFHTFFPKFLLSPPSAWILIFLQSSFPDKILRNCVDFLITPTNPTEKEFSDHKI